MKRIYSIIGTAILALTLSGCSDYLQKDPPTVISDSNFWTGESDAMLALYGCYHWPNGWDHDNFDSAQGLLYLDFAGGNGTEKENFTSTMASTATSPTHMNLTNYWANAYREIANYNTFLDNIGNCPMDESAKKVMTAEVKSLRAYFFWCLAFYFQNVPMPLTTLTVEDANTIMQTQQADVYKQIETDLQEAIGVLPDKWSGEDYGRATKGYARTLLGRLYLGQGKYTEAAKVYSDIIASGQYQIDNSNGVDSYTKLFQFAGQKSPESIFFFEFVKDKYTNVRYIYQSPEGAGGWHQFAVYNELVKEYFCTDGKGIEESEVYNESDPYMNRDPRLYASIYLPPLGSYPGTVMTNGEIYDCYGNATSPDRYDKFPLFNGYCPRKGIDPDNFAIWSNYVYTPLMRYAEVLLSYLEALNESAPSQVSQDVLDKTVNAIRARVSLPAYNKNDLPTQEAVRNAVRKERRVEMAFEGLRYFDVLRWGVAKDLLNHTFTGVKLSDDPNARNYRGSSPVDEDGYYKFETRSWDAHNRYFPIPQNDRNVNKNLVQNDGYSK